jgi:hypothetical protein
VAASQRADVKVRENTASSLTFQEKLVHTAGRWSSSGIGGREISQEDILYIRTLIERHPDESRRKLSTTLCEIWQWRQSNGALRDMVCRSMLLMLERSGQITLPPVN